MRVISAIALCACVVALAVGVSAAPAADKLTSPLPGGFPAFMSDNYAGYLSLLDGREAFYWFVASESSPSTDPVMFWFNGGPGCSSLLGLFTENGPFVFQNGGVWGRNAYTWATNLNMVFMESPGGVGFSPDLPGPGTLWNDTYVAQLNYAGVRSWLAKFPEYTGRDLYIAGESYAGHYVPQLVYQIVTGPDATLKNMLQGFMTGNPCTGSYDGTNTDLCFVADDPSLDLFLKTHALTSLVPGQIPNAPGASLPYDPYNDLVRTCPNGQGLALQKLSKRPLLHDGVGDDAAAYGPCGITHLTTWLTNPDVVSAIHAKPGMVWSGCGNVNYPTPINSSVVPLYKYFMDNTELAILVYSGTSDTVVNFIQTQKIITAMGRPVLSEFTPWYYQDMYVREWLQVGGFYIKWDRISWAGVRGAGHMVPTYQPAAAKALLNSFLTTGRPGMAPPSLTSNATLPPPPVTATQAPFPLAPEVKKPSLSKGAALMIGLGATGFVVGIVVAVLFIKRQSAPGDADFARLK